MTMEWSLFSEHIIHHVESVRKEKKREEEANKQTIPNRTESTGRVRVCQAAAEERGQTGHGEGLYDQKPKHALAREASHYSPWLTHPCGQWDRETIKACYSKLCSSLGAIQQLYTIKLKHGAVPFSLKTPRRIPVLFFRESQRRVSVYGQPERHQPRRAANWMVCRHGGRAEEEQEVCTLVCGPDWLKRAHVPWKVHSTQSGTESWNACQSEKVLQTGRHHGDERAKKCMRVEEFSFGQSAGKFIPQLSEKDKPLHDLLPKKNCWVWDVYQVTAF